MKVESIMLLLLLLLSNVNAENNIYKNNYKKVKNI
jgi:hypothetical protein